MVWKGQPSERGPAWGTVVGRAWGVGVVQGWESRTERGARQPWAHGCAGRAGSGWRAGAGPFSSRWTEASLGANLPHQRGRQVQTGRCRAGAPLIQPGSEGLARDGMGQGPSCAEGGRPRPCRTHSRTAGSVRTWPRTRPAPAKPPSAARAFHTPDLQGPGSSPRGRPPSPGQRASEICPRNKETCPAPRPQKWLRGAWSEQKQCG